MKAERENSQRWANEEEGKTSPIKEKQQTFKVNLSERNADRMINTEVGIVQRSTDTKELSEQISTLMRGQVIDQQSQNLSSNHLHAQSGDLKQKNMEDLQKVFISLRKNNNYLNSLSRSGKQVVRIKSKKKDAQSGEVKSKQIRSFSDLHKERRIDEKQRQEKQEKSKSKKKHHKLHRRSPCKWDITQPGDTQKTVIKGGKKKVANISLTVTKINQ